MKKSVAILGSEGYVGKGMVNFFKDHYDIVRYDISLKDNATKEEVNAADLAVVCVPTPMDETDGHCVTDLVDEIVGWLETPVIWIRSTIAPGTVDRLKEKYGKRIVFSPEYLGESTYYTAWDFHTDEKKVPWFILGGDKKDSTYILDMIVPIAGPTKMYRQIDAIDAEVAKYMENIYFAMKVTFANEMKKCCDALGANYWDTRDAWGLDPRVDKMHTAVFPTKPGFGGKCLPKDLMGFIKAVEGKYEPEFLKEIVKSNERFKNS